MQQNPIFFPSLSTPLNPIQLTWDVIEIKDINLLNITEHMALDIGAWRNRIRVTPINWDTRLGLVWLSQKNIPRLKRQNLQTCLHVLCPRK